MSSAKSLAWAMFVSGGTDLSQAAYQLFAPCHLESCVVFASPHSGREYDQAFMAQSVLDARLIRSSEDAFVDLLFDYVPECGAPLLCAVAPRAYIDLNRDVTELDPALIEGLRRGGQGGRVASGLGVIPRVVAAGRAIYSGKMSMKEAQARIDRVWHPYHAHLAALMAQAHARFGRAILLDCHSMPSEALTGIRPRPQIVIGDRFGASAAGDIVEQVEAAFAGAGFSVARNAPFAGAFCVQHYGRPSRGMHAIQIEIDRGLYMDESTIRPLAEFEALRERLRAVIAQIARIGSDGVDRLAAE